MSELILVRHGQATPFEADTDQLSALGEQQARAVGERLRGYAPTHVLHGALNRQRRTAALAAGLHWPGSQEDMRLSEFDGDGLIHKLVPLYAAQNPDFAALVTVFRAQSGAGERNVHFQRMLETLAQAWQRGEVIHPEVEGWDAFRRRVTAALQSILQLPSGSRVVAFTSGGVIGLMVALSLDAPDSAALRLNWRVRNASLTRFTFSTGGRISLDSFNEESHLSSDLRSWR